MLGALRRMPPKTRLALVLCLVASALALVAFLSLPSATLKLVCRHAFRTADLTVSVDGEVVHTEAITGSVSRKWLGVVEKTGGTYTTALPVKPGRRVVEVRLSAQGYDRNRSIEGDFRRGEESTLSVDAERGLSLAWRAAAAASSAAPANVAPAGGVPAWLKYAGTILLTMFGAMISGTIGVLVQDLIRSRRARLAGGKEAQREPPRAAS